MNHTHSIGCSVREALHVKSSHGFFLADELHGYREILSQSLIDYFFYFFDLCLGRTFIQGEEIEKVVNETLRKNLPVTMEFISQEEAMGRFDMKRLPDGASDTVRVVNVGDYDECLCIGLHVENTSEVGTFKIISHDWKDGIFRMRFKILPLA